MISYPEGKKENNYAIPNSIEEIGNDAFGYRCLNLVNLTIPANVIKFPKYNIFIDTGHVININVYSETVAEEYVKKYSHVERIDLGSGQEKEVGMTYSIID